MYYGEFENRECPILNLLQCSSPSFRLRTKKRHSHCFEMKLVALVDIYMKIISNFRQNLLRKSKGRKQKISKKKPREFIS